MRPHPRQMASRGCGGVCRQALTTGERCERIERSASVVTKELKSLVLKVEFEKSLRNWLFLCCHYLCRLTLTHLESMAGTTGLEPATSAVTGQRSNQLSYVP